MYALLNKAMIGSEDCVWRVWTQAIIGDDDDLLTNECLGPS